MPPVIAVTGGRLIDGRGGPPVEPANILIEGGRILDAGHAERVPVPPGAEVVDARGRSVIPGLIDMHVHTALGAGEDGLRLWLANGVTTVRDLGGDPAETLRYRDEVAAGRLPGPRIFAAGPWVQGVTGRPVPHGSPMWEQADAAQARDAVERLLEMGVDGFKLYTALQPDLFAEVVRIIDGRRWVTAHVARTWASEAVEAGVDSIEHVHASLYQDVVRPEDRHDRDGGPGSTPDYWRWLGYGWARADLEADYVRRFVDRLAASRVALSPTMVMTTGGWITDEAASDPGQRYEPRALTERRRRMQQERRRREQAGEPGPEDRPLPPEVAERARANQLAMLGMAHRAGARIVPSTDSPAVPLQVPGFSFHRELALHVEAGIPNATVLESATRLAAEVLRQSADLGTVEPGKRADLVVLDGDPLADITATRRALHVFKDGVRYDPQPLLAAVGVADTV